MLDEYLKTNLAWWDEAVGVHVGTDMYDVEAFRRGADTLSPIERDELGPLVGEGTNRTFSATSAWTRSAGRAAAPP